MHCETIDLSVVDHLEILELNEIVKLEKGAFFTPDLSGGQRKRLALMQCWMEDRPIYLFDEVAADQDPEFRKFFYRLPHRNQPKITWRQP